MTGSNAANPLFDIINEYSNSAGMSEALDQAQMALEILLLEDRTKCGVYSILLNNIYNSFPKLVTEHSSKSLYWIDRIMDWYRLHISCCIFVNWPNNRDKISEFLDKIENIYEYIDIEYGDNIALFAGMHDMRYWILVMLRRMQEEFVTNVKPDLIKNELKKDAASDFNSFDNTIKKLLEIKKPIGKKESYKNLKYLKNPYI